MQRKRFFFLYFSAVFFQAATYGLTFLLPPLFASFGADGKDVGTILAVTMITTLVSVLYLGHITSRFGRMRTIGASGLLIAVSLFLFGSSESMDLDLYVAGALLGIGWGLFYVLTPVVLTQVITADERVRYFTLLSVFVTAAIGLSPVLGAYLVEAGRGIHTVYYLVGAVCVFSSMVFFMLTGTVARLSFEEEVANSENENRLSFHLAGKVLKSKALRPILIGWLSASVFVAVINFQTVYAQLNSFEYADYFLAYTVSVIVGRILLAKPIDRYPPYAVIGVLLAVMICGVALLLVLDGNRHFYVLAAILFGIGYGVTYPIIKAMVANDADPQILSQTLQVNGLAYFIAIFGFPMIAGWILTDAGMSMLLGVALVMAAIECLLATARHLSTRKSENRQ